MTLVRGFAAIWALVACGALQAQNQTLLKELNPVAPTSFAAGATVVYRVTAACNNLVGGCGNLSIADTLPVELEARSCNAPPSVTCTITGGGTGYTVTKNPYNGGDTLAITLTTRVRLGQDPAMNIVNTATATAGNVTNPMVNSDAPPISVTGGTPNWVVRKNRIDPTGVSPAPGAPVSYRVQLCSVSGVNNVDLDNAVLVDTLPPNTTVINAGGGTVMVGMPTTVTWNLGPISLATLYGSNAANTTQCIDRFITISVPPAPTYNVGDMLINSATGTITPQGGPGVGIGPATVNDTLVGPVGNANPTKFGNDVAPSSGFNNINWRPDFDTNGSNVALTDFSFVDVLPPNAPGTAGPFDLVSIRSGTWTAGDPTLGYQIVADLQTAPAPCSASTGVYSTVTGGTGLANGANQNFAAGAAFPATDRCVRWAFRNIGTGAANEVPRAFSFGTRPQIIQFVPNGTPAGTVTNCSFVRLTAGAGPAQTEGPSCATINIEPPTPAIQVDKTRVGSGQIQPTTELVFRLSFNHLGNDSTGDIVNPTVADLLPANLEFVSWDNYSYSGPANPQPYLTVVENYGGSGRTLVRFTWNPTVPTGALTFAGAPAVGGNPATFPYTIANNQMPDMDIRVRVLPGTPAMTYTNQLSVFHQGSGFTCGGGGTTSVIDADDLDFDTNTVESRCQDDLNYTVIDAAVLLGEKWIQGDTSLPNVDDPTDAITPPGGICPDYGLTYGAIADQYTRFPCVAQTDHGGNFLYRARIQNAGNLNLDDYVLYDLLPFVGDTGSGGPLSSTARESRYRPVLTGPVVIESSNSGTSAPTIQYTTTANPCRAEVGYTAGCNAPTFVAAGAVADFSLVTAFRIFDFNAAGDFATLEIIEYSVPMRAPVSGGPPSIVGNTMIFNPTWNSFAHRARESSAGNNGPLLQVAEPPKVGIILPERYRLGNLVWIDSNNNGSAELAELGINGVNVSLCLDDDGSAGPSAGDSLLSSVVTNTLSGQPGKYAFDTLLGGTNYYLAIADGQAPLAGLLSSTNGEEAAPNNDVDNNDNGFGASGPSCAGSAIRSGLITLGPSGTTEPTTEVLRLGSATDDDNDGNPVYADLLSNYSVDFGFVPLTDLGDLPDSGAGVGTANYETLVANGGARHTIVPGIRFGACNDAELNGQPSVAANGDDAGASFYTDGVCAVANDDEDGVDQSDLDALFVFGPALIDFTATNLSASAATACGYLDFNNDGSFSGGEIATVNVPAATNGGAFSFNFGNVPVGANGTRYARFRISTDGTPCSTVNANGNALSGEVEDYVTVIALPTDLGDLPDSYGTLVSSNGPRHPARPNLQLGACFDAEVDGQPGMMALGDDIGAGTFTQGTCAAANDDEDGVQIADLNQQIGAPATLRVDVLNNTGVAAQVCGFVDWNGDGDFADTVGGTPESAIIAAPNGTAATLLLNFGTVPQQALIGATYARVRLSTDLGACTPVGAASDGEVEDYLITITATDFGDLPDPTYPTLLASNGAVHTIVPGIFLGAGVDAEIDGQPNAGANGDDLAVGDDEDGVAHPGVYGFTANELIAGRANPVQISASVPGFVNCWYDFNANGSLLDAGELVFADTALAAGVNNLSVNVPQSAAGNDVYLRCRFTSGAGQATTPTGSAPNGEVEDYLLTVISADLGDLPDSGAGTGAANYETLLASGGAEHILRADGPVFGPTVDAEANGQPTIGADGDDNTGGDDENGITVADLTFIAGSPATVRFIASNPNAAAALACAYVDWNGDGDFADTVGGTPESTTAPVAIGAVNAALSFNFGTTPTNAVQDTYARFRISTGACAPNGPQVNGEVEDYPATVLLLDLGDLPDGTAGIGNGDYQTLLANTGPAHVIVPGIKLGNDVDFEADGQPNVVADGDDSAGNTPDDEAAVDQAVLNALFRTGPALVPVAAMNTGGLGVVNVCGFIDFNADGDFDDSVAGPGGYSETAGPIAVADGTAATSVVLDFGTVPADAILDTYARFRISTNGACSAVGTAPNGEVEDYALNVIPLDMGDLPENGGNWSTTLANNGPRHVIFPEIFLGTIEDLEVDGAPSVDADGDDLAGSDDEDGVDQTTLRFIAGRTTTVNVTATNNAGSIATICGYVDLDANDSFEPSELVSAVVPDGSNAVVVPLNFAVPTSVVTGSSYARFRLSSDGNACAPNGLALDGEVEDYVVELVELDLGDLPDTGAGNGSGNYETLDSDSGPAHVIVTGMKLGAVVDSEDDGQPNVAADGDDSAGTPDDEDGVAADQLEILAGLTGIIELTAMNQAGLGDANVCGFIDYNADGDFADAGEIAGPVVVVDGTATTVVALNFGTVPLNAAQNTYARFRISTDPACSPIDEAPNGEVEDYPLVITRRDLGDLPDTGAGVGVGNYRTLLADNGAAHDIVDGLYMGAGVDQEIDGQPNAATTGDDLAGPTPDDEDGVSQVDLDNLHLGSPANVSVVATNTTGAAVRLCGFIDHNRDGDFADISESAEVAVPNGSNAANFVLSFGAVPINVAQGPTFARFRLQSAACAADGLVNDGEVEDYLAMIGPGEMSLGNLVWEDADNSGIFNGESGLPGVPVNLFLDSNNDGVPDGGSIGSLNTDPNGNYLFVELVPETYIVCVTAPSTYISSSGTGRPFAATGPNEPGPDPDNDANDDDNGTAGTPVTNICSSPVTLVFGGEPTNDGDADNLSNLSVDFGLLYNFDLAIRKVLAVGQAFEVNIGDNVNYTITVFNQGTVEARNITVTDYLPPGFNLADAAWTAGPNNTASRVIPGPLAPGAQTEIGLTLLVTAAAVPGDVVNLAEISRAEDPSGATPIDKDSDGDVDPINDGTPVDDAIDNEGGDEDDSDPATVDFGIGVIGVAKDLQDLFFNEGSRYGGAAAGPTANLSFVFTLENFGTRDISQVSLIDDLNSILTPGGSVEVLNVMADGLLVANPSYTGVGSNDLLLPASVLPRGSVASVRLDLLLRTPVAPALPSVNTATASGVFPNGQPVSDVSHDGLDPDPEGDSDPSNNGDPTPVNLTGLVGVIAVPIGGAPMLILIALMLAILGWRQLRKQSAPHSRH